MTARAASRSSAAATVGPDAMVAGSSPTTSDTTRVTILAGASTAASPPPLMSESRRRTELTAPISAPQRNSARLVAIRSARSMPGIGASTSAEPPPETSTRAVSSGPSEAARLSSAYPGTQTVVIWDGMPAQHELDAFGYFVFVVGYHETLEPVSVERASRPAGHRRSRLTDGEHDHSRPEDARGDAPPQPQGRRRQHPHGNKRSATHEQCHHLSCESPRSRDTSGQEPHHSLPIRGAQQPGQRPEDSLPVPH